MQLKKKSLGVRLISRRRIHRPNFILPRNYGNAKYTQAIRNPIVLRQVTRTHPQGPLIYPQGAE